jgi:hypothetical protein
MDKAWKKACKRMKAQGERAVKTNGRRWDKRLGTLAREWTASALGPSKGGMAEGRARRIL